jgi:hypothetical protein
MRRILSGLAIVGGLWFAWGAAPQAQGEGKKSEEKAKAAPNCDLTLEQFMKTKVKATISDSGLSLDEKNQRLKRYFTAILELAPDPAWNEGSTSWKALTQEAIDKNSYGRSCRACHTTFEEQYKKSHHEHKVCIDPELLK